MFYYYCEYLLTRAGSFLLNCFPIALSNWTAVRVGELCYWFMPKRRKVCLDNLNIAFGNRKSPNEKKVLAKKTFGHLILSLFELYKMTQFAPSADKNIAIRGGENLKEAMAQKKGVVLVMSHLGSWEYLAFLPYLMHYPCTILGKRLSNPFINNWVRQLRTSVQLDTCNRSGGLKTIVREIRNNNTVAIVIDQWAGNDGLWIDFFNQPASTTSMPARLASKTGCLLVPIYCVRTAPGKYDITVLPQLNTHWDNKDGVNQLTIEINRIFEKIISEHPEQWLWTHRRWKGKKKYKTFKEGRKIAC